jgi:hypothetical protein
MKYSTLVSSAFTALAVFAGIQARAADTDEMASLSIDTGTEALTLSPHWAIRPNLSGFHFMAQNMGLTGGAANQFYSLKGSALPSGDITGFTYYVATSLFGTDHQDISVKLTNIEANSTYSGLTSADPDLGTAYGAVRLYTIHHTTGGDFLTVIKTSSATASDVSDPKPMSGPGGTGTGYFGLTFSADNLGSGADVFYYLRTDPSDQHIKFGSLAPALASAPADLFDLGLCGAKALAYTADQITTRYGVSQMYFLRLDPITGFTIFATLNPVTGKASDIANLGSVYNTLTYVPGDVGYGSTQFYTTGTLNPTWQSVSFAAIADRDTVAGSFTVNPTASSALPITLTVVSGSVGAASISAPVGGVFTVTPTAPGLITLQASQAGSPSYEANMLRQSFTITGTTLLAITTQPVAQIAVTGTTATFSVVANGSSTVTYQWRKAGVAIVGNASALTATLSLPNVQLADTDTYDVVVTNLSGSLPSDAVTLTVNASSIVFSSADTASGIVGTPFSFAILASDSPTTYTASPLPAGLTVNASTGIISGTPTSAGPVVAMLSAGNIDGTSYATLTITVIGIPHVAIQGPAGSIDLTNGAGPPPSGTVYYVKGLPKDLVLDPATGIITGTATARPGTYTLTYGTVTTGIGGHKTYGPVRTLVFVVDPLSSAISGGFESILETPPAPGVPVGKVELLVNAQTGVFTGRLTTATDAKIYAFRGTLAVNSTYDGGTASVKIVRGAGNNPYQLDLVIDSTLADDQVFLATLQQLNASNVVVSTLGESDTGVQLATYTSTTPTPWQGNYTLILDDPTTPPSDLGVNVIPEGTGYGLITIRAAGGLMICNGRLGDGTPLTASVAPSADGSYRWYVKPYKSGGTFAGWLQFTPVAGFVAPFQVVGDTNSELYWTKNASSSHDVSYRAGFGPVVIVATAQRWTPPASGTHLNTSLQLSSGMLASSFTSAGLPDADLPLMPTAVTLTDANKFVVTAPAPTNDLKVRSRTFDGSITTATGLFTGHFMLQDSRWVSITGVLMQQPSVVSGSVIGEGFFLIPPATPGAEGVSGKVQFIAP